MARGSRPSSTSGDGLAQPVREPRGPFELSLAAEGLEQLADPGRGDVRGKDHRHARGGHLARADAREGAARGLAGDGLGILEFVEPALDHAVPAGLLLALAVAGERHHVRAHRGAGRSARQAARVHQRRVPVARGNARAVGAADARVAAEGDPLERERHLDAALGGPREQRRIRELEFRQRLVAGVGGCGEGVGLVGRGEARQRHGVAREFVQRGGREVGARDEALGAAHQHPQAEPARHALLEALDLATVHPHGEGAQALEAGLGVVGARPSRALHGLRAEAQERFGLEWPACAGRVAHVPVPPTVIPVKRTVG
jgi:hypothetical protein